MEQLNNNKDDLNFRDDYDLRDDSWIEDDEDEFEINNSQ